MKRSAIKKKTISYDTILSIKKTIELETRKRRKGKARKKEWRCQFNNANKKMRKSSLYGKKRTRENREFHPTADWRSGKRGFIVEGMEGESYPVVAQTVVQAVQFPADIIQFALHLLETEKEPMFDQWPVRENADSSSSGHTDDRTKWSIHNESGMQLSTKLCVGQVSRFQTSKPVKKARKIHWNPTQPVKNRVKPNYKGW